MGAQGWGVATWTSASGEESSVGTESANVDECLTRKDAHGVPWEPVMRGSRRRVHDMT